MAAKDATDEIVNAVANHAQAEPGVVAEPLEGNKIAVDLDSVEKGVQLGARCLDQPDLALHAYRRRDLAADPLILDRAPFRARIALEHEVGHVEAERVLDRRLDGATGIACSVKRLRTRLEGRTESKMRRR